MIAAIVGVCLALGGVLLVASRLTWSPSITRRMKQRWHTLDKARRTSLVIGSVAGMVIVAFTGFIPALVLMPLAMVVIPQVLSSSPNREIDLLEALDRWVWALASSTNTGKSVVEAIRVNRNQTPELLREPVRGLLVRLDQRSEPRRAIFAMADELDSADADAVLAALILMIERGGTGTAVTMAGLSEQIRERLHALREIHSEREKPRVVVRQVTVITLVVITGAILMTPAYFAPYTTAAGQVIAVLLVTVYLGSLIALRRAALPRARERILVGHV